MKTSEYILNIENFVQLEEINEEMEDDKEEETPIKEKWALDISYGKQKKCNKLIK